MRRKLLAANWKMNKTLSESIDLVQDMLQDIEIKDTVEVLLAPAYPMLYPIHELIKDKPIHLAAQNVCHKPSGAFTGEVSAEMIKSVGAGSVIVGHSERREYFSETTQQLIEKVHLALKHDLNVIYCIGESENIRKEGAYMAFIIQQLEEVLSTIPSEQSSKVTIAYEPIWAIGSGQSANSSQIEEVHNGIRASLIKLFGEETGLKIRILYGGSVKPENAKSIFSTANVDGALVGGASLDAKAFCTINQEL